MPGDDMRSGPVLMITALVSSPTGDRVMICSGSGRAQTLNPLRWLCSQRPMQSRVKVRGSR